MKKNSKSYKVWYDKKKGGVGSVIVKAENPAQAIKNAKQHVFTGRKFRNPRKVDDGAYLKPRKQGFQGSGRVN
jgi:hypothetical protein